MEGKHTPGKLSLNNYHYPYAYLVIRKGSDDNDAFPRPRKICDVTLDGKTEEEYEANAKRLVKCWNSHDALLAALESINEHENNYHRIGIGYDYVVHRIVKAALKLAEKGE